MWVRFLLGAPMIDLDFYKIYYLKHMIHQFTAIYKKQGKWFSAWVEEIPGVNTQGRTLKEAKENLKEALSLVIEVSRAMSKKEMSGQVIREPLKLSTK